MIRFDAKGGYIDPNLIPNTCRNAEKVLAIQVEKDTRPFVPALTMSLNQRTRVIGSHILYPGPYARYLWFGVAMVDSVTGKGPMKIPEVGYRFHKGATLKPTTRPLNFTKTVHPQATSYWFIKSKGYNLPKWIRTAKEAVDNGL